MATEETPLKLTYGLEAVLPIEVALHRHRLIMFKEELNNVVLQEALDLFRSVRGDVLIREALCKLYIARLHNRTVKLHHIKVRDVVLCCTEVVVRTGEDDKLTTN